MRQWTPEQRARQAQRIHQYKPWIRSTGPKTAEGKRISSRNAYSPNLHTPEIEAIRSYLDASRLLLKMLSRKRKEREEARKAARRTAKQKVAHIIGDAPLPSLENSPPLEGGRLRPSAKGAPIEAGGVAVPSATSHTPALSHANY